MNQNFSIIMHDSGTTSLTRPAFADAEAERQLRKERLAAALRLFGRFGLTRDWLAI